MKPTLNITPIPAFSDNYIWCLQAPGNPGVFVVDPGDGDAVLQALEQRGLELAGILITHHHFDHTGGLDRLLAAGSAGSSTGGAAGSAGEPTGDVAGSAGEPTSNIPVFGPKGNPHSPAIPQLGTRLAEGDQIEVLGATFDVLEVPGHTLDHIAYVCRDHTPPLLFCGDTLFAGGCGRLFEGDPPTMAASLAKLAALPADTEVYCAHEYTLANLAFAQAVEPDNAALAARVARDSQARERGQPTVPSALGLELDTNPFLRCAEADLARRMQERAGVNPGDPVAVFAAVRDWKDNF